MMIISVHGEYRLSLYSRFPSLPNAIQFAILSSLRDLTGKGVNIAGFRKRRIGNDVYTLFCSDYWLDLTPLRTRFPRVFDLKNEQDITVLSKFQQDGWESSFRCAPRSRAELAQWEVLFLLLHNVLLYLISEKLCWSLQGSGDFLVSFSRSHIDRILLPSISCQFQWNKLVPIKLNMFIWRLVLDRLLFRWNLS